MLKSLYIKNYAIIEELELSLGRGLNVFTGETGAGKSIILGALGLILGDRSDRKSLFDKSSKCVVRALFTNISPEIKSLFEALDILFEPEMYIQREIWPNGKSKAFINDTPVKLKDLKDITLMLIDLHRQFDQMDILEKNRQIQYLDAYIAHQDLVGQYRKGYERYQKIKQNLETLTSQRAETIKELEFLRFQLDELQHFSLDVERDSRLESELAILLHAEELRVVLDKLQHHIDGAEPSSADILRESIRSLSKIEPLPEYLEALSERLNSLLNEMEDLTNEIGDIREQIEPNEQMIEKMTERLDTLNQLFYKHQVSEVKDLLGVQKKLEDRLAAFQSTDEAVEKLRQELESEEKTLIAAAEKISKARKSALKNFGKQITEILYKLEMPEAQFIPTLQTKPLGPEGMDHIEFLFSANLGSTPKKLKDIASGGELSRLNLSLKSLIVGKIRLPTIVFDEIDTGISGKTSLQMALLLKQLASKHQIICISHSPQIAAKANHHLHVYKQSSAEKTTTRVKTLDSRERIYNIAVMLSSEPPTKAALANAKELINY